MKSETYYFCKEALEDGSVAFWKITEDEVSFFSYDGKMWSRYGNYCPAIKVSSYKEISKRKFEEISFVENL